MTEFFKINEEHYFGVIIQHILSFLPTWNFSLKNQLSPNAVVPQHINVKHMEKIRRQTKNYLIIISM